MSYRPSEGRPVSGSLAVLVILGLAVGLVAFTHWAGQREQRLEKERAAARKKEAEADRLVSELKDLPPGRMKEFDGGGQRRQEFLRATPAFREQLEKAEDDWMGRTLAGIDREAAGDPAAAIAALRELRSDCQKGGGQRLVPQVERALDRVVRSAAESSAGLLDRDGVQALDLAVRCLEPFVNGKEEPPAPLTEARQRALDRCVKDLSARLEKLLAEDGGAVSAWLKDRKAVEAAAHCTVEPLRQAEERWLGRTVAALLAKVEPPAGQDAEKVFARLEQMRTSCAELLRDHPDARRTLTAGEGRCLQAAVDRAVAEAGKQDSPAATIARLRQTATACGGLLGDHEGPASKLREARREAVNDALKKARAEATKLIKADRFQAAAALSEQLCKDLEADAKAVGVADALTRLRDDCGYYADLARQAGRSDPP
jgi:hypothetical protein